MVYTMTSILVNAGSFKLLLPKKKNDHSPRFEPEEEGSDSLGPKLTVIRVWFTPLNDILVLPQLFFG